MHVDRKIIGAPVGDARRTHHREPIVHLMTGQRVRRRRRLQRKHRAARIGDETGAPPDSSHRDPQRRLETVRKQHAEIESPRADLADNSAPIEKSRETAPNRVRNHLVDPSSAIKEARELFLDEHREMRARPRAPNRPQRRQAHHDIAQPVNFLDQDAARRRIEHDARRRSRRRVRLERLMTPNIFRFHANSSPRRSSIPSRISSRARRQINPHTARAAARRKRKLKEDGLPAGRCRKRPGRCVVDQIVAVAC